MPWGVDSGQFWSQTEVAHSLNPEATNVTRSTSRRTDHYPNSVWRHFRFFGTEPVHLVDYVTLGIDGTPEVD